MIVWPGLRRSMGTRAGIPIANRAAHFDAALGITSAGGFASAWADQSGNGRSLLQASGGNQPIHLAYSGTKYAYLPGVASNSLSTPSKASITAVVDEADLIWGGALTDYTIAAYQTLWSLYNTAATPDKCGLFMENASSGKLVFIHVSGTTVTVVPSSVSAGLTDGTFYQLRAYWSKATGLTKFYKRAATTDAWTQIGSDVASPVTSMNAGSRNLFIGILSDGTSLPAAGNHYTAQLWSGNSESGGTLVADCNPNRDYVSGSTFVSSTTGETYTVNSTGSKPAQIVDRASLLFDGAAHFMKTAAFTLNQPETVFLVGRQITWTSTDTLLDGDAVNTGAITQTTGTPQINLNAGSSVAGNTEMTLATRKVICAVFNGPSSSLQVTTGTATTGNAGAGNMGGITLGAAGSNLLFSNIQAYELLAYSAALDAATRANVIRALMSKHGVA